MPISLKKIAGGLEITREIELDCLADQPEGERSVVIRLMSLSEIREIYPVDEQGNMTGNDGPEQMRQVIGKSLIDPETGQLISAEAAAEFMENVNNALLTELMKKITAANQGTEAGEP